MAIGTVKCFNSTGGYGFIQPEDGSANVFVHISAVDRSGIGHLNEGQKLSFEAVRDPWRGNNQAWSPGWPRFTPREIRRIALDPLG